MTGRHGVQLFADVKVTVYFRETEAFGADSDDVSAAVTILPQRRHLASTVMMSLPLEQYFRAAEAFAANSDDISVWSLEALGLKWENSAERQRLLPTVKMFQSESSWVNTAA